MVKKLLAGLVVLGAMVVTGSTALAQRVDQLYTNNCIQCHGDRGQGGGAGTSTLLTDELMDPRHDRRFFDAIKKGVPDMGMPEFGQSMDDAEIWALVGYIRELQARDHRQRVGSPTAEAGVYRSQHHAFRIERVIEQGLEIPWSVDFLPDGRMLVADRPGQVRIHSTGKQGGTLSQPIAGTPAVRHRGQGGLMDVAVHPNYGENGWIYLSFSDPLDRDGEELAMTKIVRGRVREEGGKLVWVDEEPIFRARDEHYLSGGLHFGCRIVFDPRDPGIMYFSIGERGRQEMAQDLARPNGKVHRIRDDGSIPQDNPFVDRSDETYKSIWSYGNRNVQGLSFDPPGNLWATEHGPRGGDELNLIMPGRNYGWPTVSFGFHYNGRPFVTPWPQEPIDASESNPDGIVMPVYRWMPSIGACGLDTARGPAFERWHGDLLAGGLSGQNVDRLRVKDGQLVEREELLHGLGRVRDVVCAPDGTVYVVLNGPDKVIRLLPQD